MPTRKFTRSPFVIFAISLLLSIWSLPVNASISLNIHTSNASTEIFDGFQFLYDGSIIVSAANGTAPYVYEIQNHYKRNNGYFPGLQPGSYTIIVTDATGASSDSTVVINYTYPQPSVSVLSATLPSAPDAADGRIVFSGAGGTPPYSYSIDNGNTFTATNTFTGLTQGAYPVLIKDANGQLAWLTVDPRFVIAGNMIYLEYKNAWIIDELSAPSVRACNDEGCLHIAVISSFVQPVTWSLDGVHYMFFPPSVFNPQQYSTIKDTCGLPAGVYHAYTKDGAGRISVFAAAILQYCSVQIQSIGTKADCHGSNGALTINVINGSPPYRYTMDGINYQSSNMFSGLSAGNYGISVKDANGQIVSAGGVVYDNCPVIKIVETDSLCGLGMITASGNQGAAPYRFTIDGLHYQTSGVFDSLGSGVYTIGLMDVNGFKDSVTATVHNKACFSVNVLTADESCEQKNGTVTINATGGTAPYIFSLDGVHFQQQNIFGGLDSGRYMAIVKDVVGLSDTVIVHIKDVPSSKISLGNDTVLCEGQNLLLQVTLPEVSSVCYWQDGSSGNTYTVKQKGSYWVRVNTNGCLSTDTIHINFITKIGTIFSTHDTTLCSGDTLLLNGDQTASSYTWDDQTLTRWRYINTPGLYKLNEVLFGCFSSDSIVCHFIPPPVKLLPVDTSFCEGSRSLLYAGDINQSYQWNDGTHGNTLTVNKAGLYTVKISEKQGCSIYDSVTVRVLPLPVVHLGNDTTLCAGQTLLLNAFNNNASYQWQDGSKNPQYSVQKNGNYYVRVMLAGCEADDSITIAYNIRPTVHLGNDTTLCTTETLLLDVANSQASYLWQDGSNLSVYEVKQAGIYSVRVTNECGTAQDSIHVVYRDCACQFFVPTAFTPNGDGLNDVFKPGYRCLFKNYRMQIFNRFGQHLFETTDINSGWNGYFNGIAQTMGTYIWVISYTDRLTGTINTQTGTVVLIK